MPGSASRPVPVWHAAGVLFAIVAATMAAAWVGGAFTAPAVAPGGWYQTLIKPPLTPPGAAFGIAWTFLYAVMALAAWRAWRSPAESARANRALGLYGAQLILNGGWSYVFFASGAMAWALVVLTALAVLLAIMARVFYANDRIAGLLVAPYLAWVCFATYLNAGFLVLNGGV